MQSDVVGRHPRARGKITIAFTVGRDGHPTDPMVFGFDPAIDAELEEALAAVTLPRTFAGQMVQTSLVLTGAPARQRASAPKRARAGK